MRRIGTIGMVAALAALASASTAGAASPQSTATQVRSVKVFQVKGRVKVDVVVSQPDARAAKPSKRATNDGVVLMAVHGADGEILATRTAHAALPVSVPSGSAVLQSYRFSLSDAEGARVAAAGDVKVSVLADTRLDDNGAADGGMTSSTDVDTIDASVQTLAADPTQWQFFWVSFTTGPFCDLDGDNCSASWSRLGTRPFQGGGRMDIRYASGGYLKHIKITDGDSYVQGSTDSSLSKAEFPITGGKVASWNATNVFSGGFGDGKAGEPGGPLYLDIEGSVSHDFLIHGYLACSGDGCSIPAPG
jgi:hypothetical protein